MAIVPTTWNPSDRTGMTLSNGNLTTVSTGVNGGIRSVYSTSTGKWYWEWLFSTGAGIAIGIANTSAAFATVWATPTNAALAYNGSIYVNNVVVSGAGVSIPLGTTVCIAVDLGAHLIWFRAGAAGNWNNSGTANPATGTGGANIAVLGSPLLALLATSTAINTSTANFGATAFVGSVPSGFTAGLGPDVVAATQARAMVLA